MATLPCAEVAGLRCACALLWLLGGLVDVWAGQATTDEAGSRLDGALAGEYSAGYISARVLQGSHALIETAGLYKVEAASKGALAADLAAVGVAPVSGTVRREANAAIEAEQRRCAPSQALRLQTKKKKARHRILRVRALPTCRPAVIP